MQIHLTRRAEIALRSLSPREQNHIRKALETLSVSERVDLCHSRKMKMIASGAMCGKVFVYQSSNRFHLVLSFGGEECVVEDIVDYDRLVILGKQGGHVLK